MLLSVLTVFFCNIFIIESCQNSKNYQSDYYPPLRDQLRLEENQRGTHITKEMTKGDVRPQIETIAESDVNKEHAEIPFLSPPRGCDGILLKKRKINLPTEPQSTESSLNETHRDMSIKEILLKEANYDIDDPSNTKKRLNYLSWDDYFMAVSFLSAQRSRDPVDRAGACIVNEENRIVGIGYNGFPRDCPDECLPWATVSEESVLLHTKNPFMCQAEINAVLNKISPDVRGCKMYVSRFPNNDCAKVIIQAGITEIVYERDPIKCDSTCASRILFKLAGVKTRQYRFPTPIAPLDFSAFEMPMQKNEENLDEVKKSKLSAVEESISKYKQLLKDEANYDITRPKVIHRKDNLSWDDYFTAVAYLTARRSKDPSTQVGAAIVDANNCIIGVGYNGFPTNCSDDHLPWARAGDSVLQKKYPYVVHAEVNAILNKGSKDVKGARLYVALFPCNECAKVIIQAGIKEVVYLNDKVSSVKYMHKHFL